jgi:hypothetical protein
MLRSQTPGHRELAVRYLLENGYASKLRPYAALDLGAPGGAALIRNEIRKAGWRIIDTDDEFNIEPSTDVERLLNPPEAAKAQVKTGRNDPCPCGSGKKYKRCCGG